MPVAAVEVVAAAEAGKHHRFADLAEAGAYRFTADPRWSDVRISAEKWRLYRPAVRPRLNSVRAATSALKPQTTALK